jgi:hypothetical protein
LSVRRLIINRWHFPSLFLQRDRSRQAACIRLLTRQQASPIACHSHQELRGASRGHLSWWCCILRSGRTLRHGLSAPSTRLRRGASNSVRDCTRLVDGTANPLRVSAEPFALSPSLSLLSTSLFPLLGQNHHDYATELICLFGSAGRP